MIHKMKAWLVKNHLTTDTTDYVAVVDSNGSIDVSGIVDELIAEGMELKRETAVDVVSRYNRKCADLALSGYSVNTGLVQLRATVKGAFYDKRWDPERNQLHVSVTQSAELRKAAAAATVEILGEHGELIALFGITDLSTGKTDGTVTRGFNAELKGTYIKVAGDDPTVGVYLHNVDTGEDIILPATNIALNEPSRLLLLVPADIVAGTYELRVTTQYMSNNKLLKTPRSAVLPIPLSVL